MHRPQLLKTLVCLVVLALLASAINPHDRTTWLMEVLPVAILLPAVMSVARETDLPPSKLLIPLAWASLLGGNVTMIGTPPNIIVASFREEAVGKAFGMFDFAPVGGPVAVVGFDASFATEKEVGSKALPFRGGLTGELRLDVPIGIAYKEDIGAARRVGHRYCADDAVGRRKQRREPDIKRWFALRTRRDPHRVGRIKTHR